MINTQNYIANAHARFANDAGIKTEDTKLSVIERVKALAVACFAGLLALATFFQCHSYDVVVKEAFQQFKTGHVFACCKAAQPAADGKPLNKAEAKAKKAARRLLKREAARKAEQEAKKKREAELEAARAHAMAHAETCAAKWRGFRERENATEVTAPSTVEVLPLALPLRDEAILPAVETTAGLAATEERVVSIKPAATSAALNRAVLVTKLRQSVAARKEAQEARMLQAQHVYRKQSATAMSRLVFNGR
jgi:hypothetical protein